MDPMEAMEVTRDPDEQENLTDDHLIHRDDDYPAGVEHDGEVEPSPRHEQLPPEEGTLTTDIEKGTKPKKPRSKAQQEAFAKARKALAEKRAKVKQEKEQNKKPRGRPRAPPKKEKKAPRVVFQVPEDDEVSSESSEEEVVYVQRKKPKPKKKKAPKQPRIVYVTDSDDEEEEMAQQHFAPPQQMTDYYNFV
eukprot:COSAG01_NODE_2882_length_6914_cov_40.714894_2_plen_192_part_00